MKKLGSKKHNGQIQIHRYIFKIGQKRRKIETLRFVPRYRKFKYKKKSEKETFESGIG
jgi:hypothetical protein